MSTAITNAEPAVTVIDANGYDLAVDSTTLADLLEDAGLSWKYYARVGTFSLIRHIRNLLMWANALNSSVQFLGHAQIGRLPAMSWVRPPETDSEHGVALLIISPFASQDVRRILITCSRWCWST